MLKKELTPEQKLNKKLSDHKHWEKIKVEHPEKIIEKKQRDHNYYLKNRAKVLAKTTEYRINNKEKVNAQHITYYYKHKRPPKIRIPRTQTQINASKERHVLLSKERYNMKAISISASNIIKRRELKKEVLTHYGNGILACIKCGYDKSIYALSIDHINGNGNEHRRNNKEITGDHVYQWLKKNNYPEGYQTLCMNCQYIKRIENHELANKYFHSKPLNKNKGELLTLP